MRTLHLYISDQDYELTPSQWTAGQTALLTQWENEFSRACDNLGVYGQSQCIIRPFRELQKYPDVMRHFGVTAPPVVLIHDEETGRTVQAAADARDIERAYRQMDEEGGGGVNPFTDGQGGNPFGVLRIPIWAWAILALLLLNRK